MLHLLAAEGTCFAYGTSHAQMTGPVALQPAQSELGATYLPNGCAHPGAMVIKPLYAVVIDRAVVSSWWLVEVAGIIVAYCDSVAIDCNVFGPVATSIYMSAADGRESCNKVIVNATRAHSCYSMHHATLSKCWLALMLCVLAGCKYAGTLTTASILLIGISSCTTSPRA